MFSGEQVEGLASSSATEMQDQSRNFFGPSRQLYFYFKIAGNIEAIREIKKTCAAPNLESLNLACTAIDDGVIDTIIKYLIINKDTALKELNLSGNNFTDMGINKLLEAIRLAPNCKLVNLVIRGNSQLTQNVVEQVDALMLQQRSKNNRIVF